MKSKMGPRTILYPLPTILVGVNVNNKPNYMAVAHCGIVALVYVTISLRKGRYTSAGIKENGAFSVNIPSVELVKKTDYCGLVSGSETDKSQLFESFYGTLGNVPMINECPVNMECLLKQTVDFPTHEIFIGEVVETYCEEYCFKDGVFDLARIQPILYGPNAYWKIGEPFAKPFNVGKDFPNYVTQDL